MITARTAAEKAQVLGVFQEHAEDHGYRDERGPGVVNTVRRLGMALFGDPNKMVRAASNNGGIARSAWINIGGKQRYFCFDHETHSIAMKDKKGGKIIAYFSDDTTDAELLHRITL